MELVQVKILGQAITSRYGTLNAGDILHTDAAFAKHLVEDCGAADYVTAQNPTEDAAERTESKVASGADDAAVAPVNQKKRGRNAQ